MLPTTLARDIAEPAVTTDAVGEKVGTEVPAGGVVVAGLELLLVWTGVVDTGVVVVNDPGTTVPGTTVPGATVPGMTVIPDIPDTVIDPPTANPAVAQPHTVHLCQ